MKKNGTTAGQPPEPATAQNELRMVRNHSLAATGYSLPELHTGNCWYIDYYTWDTARGRGTRHRVKLDRYRKKPRGKAYAREVVASLTAQLRRGWRPGATQVAPKAHYSLRQGVAAFLAAKKHELNLSSPEHYASWARLFLDWCAQGGLADKEVHLFGRGDARAYLDHCLEHRRLAPSTWNNQRTFLAGLFNWLVERDYRPDNPFSGIRSMKVRGKGRVFLEPHERDAVVGWLRVHDVGFLSVCLYVYHTLIRPRELARLRVHQVDLAAGVIHLRADQTKNGEAEVVAIPDVMLPHLDADALRRSDPQWYLVGSDFRPGPKPAHRNTYQRHWRTMAEAVRLRAGCQLYSLRDTGIIQLLRDGVDLVDVMRQARHKHVRTTNNYVQHAFPSGVEAVRKKASPLSA